MARRRRSSRKNTQPEVRSISTSYEGEYSGTFMIPTLSGQQITEQTALSITAVWNAVNIYANTIASLDLYVAERDPRGGRRPAYDHPVYDLIYSRPNRNQTSLRYRQRLVADYLVEGNHYSEIEFKGNEPTALHPLDPHNVKPYISDSGDLNYHLVREHRDLPAWRVLHIAGLTGHDGIKGYSPIHLAKEALGLAIAEQKYQAALMGNSAMPAGYLKVPQTMKEDAQQRLRDGWNKVHQSTDRAGNLAILSGGMEWVATSFSPEDAQTLLSRNFSVAEVARLFNLPQHMLNGEEQTNVEEANLQFYQLSLRPHLINIEQEMNRKLILPEDQKTFFVRHDERSLIRGNMAATAAYHTSMFNIGVLSENEIRLEQGLNPIDHPNADKHYIPVNNLMAVEDIQEPGAIAIESDASPDAETQVTPPATDEVPATDQVQDTALNGAQIESLTNLANEVAAGNMPPDAAKALISAAFPMLTDAQVSAIIDPLRGFKPAGDPAAPAAPPATDEVQDAIRQVVESDLARMVRRECQAVRKASRREGFYGWLEGFYGGHMVLVAEAIAPSLRAYSVLVGASYDPITIAGQIADESRERLRGLLVCLPPDELPAAVERVCEEWEADRAVACIRSLGCVHT